MLLSSRTLPLLLALFALGAPGRASTTPESVDRVAIQGEYGHSMAFDAARERVVMFGLGGTWTWTGEAWQDRSAGGGPSSRRHADMAYDPLRERVVLFGGEGSLGLLADTWEWDGFAWKEIPAPIQPSARKHHAMAFDPVTGKVLLFGGNELEDTWEWDGVSWSERVVPLAPSVWRPVMVTDDARREVLLHAHGETWIWDGAGWQRRATPNLALWFEVDEALPLAYDSVRERVVLLGRELGTAQLATWEWDGTDWMQAAVGGIAERTWEQKLAFDAVRGEVVAFGGRFAQGQQQVKLPMDPAETWCWDGAAWSLRGRSPGRVTSARGLVHDTLRGRVVSFDTHGLLADPPNNVGYWGVPKSITREWDGLQWELRKPVTQPRGRIQHAASFDAGRGVTVLFGGLGFDPLQGREALADTWEWNGLDWTERMPGSSPAARYDHALAHDRGRGRSLLFGGRMTCGSFCDGLPMGGTWEWDGSSWIEMNPVHEPVPRGGHALAHDPLRGRTVLHGGVGQSGEVLMDTWEWDGAEWTSVTTLHVPPATGHAMAWDPDRQRVVLSAQGEHWEFDGMDWQLARTGDALPGDGEHALARDPLREAMVVLGGGTTRLVGDVTAPSVVRLDAGCTSGSQPRLRSAPVVVGESTHPVILDGVAPNAPVIFALSRTLDPRLLSGGCTWFPGDDALFVPTRSSVLGHAEFAFSLPAQLGVLGLDLHVQAALPGELGQRSLASGLILRVGG